MVSVNSVTATCLQNFAEGGGKESASLHVNLGFYVA
jgi:hypothetical protein